ncbi:hypothetical protein V1507DRAFT_83975 [Lipomyces tetrasporus]
MRRAGLAQLIYSQHSSRPCMGRRLRRKSILVRVREGCFRRCERQFGFVRSRSALVCSRLGAYLSASFLTLFTSLVTGDWSIVEFAVLIWLAALPCFPIS